MADLADHSAATSAGYVRTQVDYGSGSASSPRYLSYYVKPMVGQPGATGGLFRADGSSNSSQAGADTAALDALNGARKLRYGLGASAGYGGYGQLQTIDVS